MTQNHDKALEIWDVWLVATTNSCVTFVAKLDGIPASSGPEAGAKAINQALDRGLNIVLMLGSVPLLVTPISCVPFKIEKSNRVTLTTHKGDIH